MNGALTGIFALAITVGTTGTGTYIYHKFKEKTELKKEVLVLREQLINFIAETNSERAKKVLSESNNKKMKTVFDYEREVARLKNEKEKLNDEYVKEEMNLLAEAREKLGELIYIDNSGRAEQELDNSFRVKYKTADRAMKERVRLNKITESLVFAIKKDLLDEIQNQRNKLYILGDKASNELLGKSFDITETGNIKQLKKEISRLKKLIETIEKQEKDELLKTLSSKRNELFSLIKDDIDATLELEASYKIAMDKISITEEIDRLIDVIASTRRTIRRKNYSDLMEIRSKLEEHSDERRIEDVLNKSYNKKLNDLLLPKEIETLESTLKERDIRMNQVKIKITGY